MKSLPTSSGNLKIREVNLTGDHASPVPELTISELLRILKRRRLLMGGIALLLAAAGIVVCLLSTREYYASGTIEVTRQNQAELDLDQMKGEQGSSADALEDNIAIQTQASILESDTLALKVIKDLGLEDTPDFRPHRSLLRFLWRKPETSSGSSDLEDSPARRTDALRVFQRHLTVKSRGGTRLIEIGYSSSVPQTAAAVVNELTKDLVDYTFQTHYNATNAAARWLASQMDDLKKEAEDRQSKVVQLQREAGVYSLGAVDASGKELAYSATLDRLQQATDAMAQATSNRILKGSIYEMVSKGGPDSISGLSGSSLSGSSPEVNNSFALLQTLRGQQAALQSQVTADASKYGSANPKLQDEKAALASITAAVSEEIDRIGERAKNDYLTAVSSETRLQADYQQQREAADHLNDKAIEYSIAKQEANESRQLYETLYQHLKEAGVVEGLRSSNVTVIDPGRIPSLPTKPNIPMTMGLSIFAGLLCGALAAYLVDSIDDRVQSIDAMERTLNAPLLGVIPQAAFLKAPPRPQRANKNSLPLLNSGSAMAGPDCITAAPGASQTAFSESLRSLRTALLQSQIASPPKLILITSAAEAEGKTTISLHLAAALARNQSKVLLVEADMRCPKVADRLSLSNQKGLSTFLIGHEEVTVARPFSDLPSLAIIPAGPTPPYPAELLGSPQMKKLIDDWSQSYDFVVIDTPSVLAVTDAVVLSRRADIVVLVSRHAKSTRKSLERAWRLLTTNTDLNVAAVLNGVDRTSPAYQEYFGYRGTRYYETREAS